MKRSSKKFCVLFITAALVSFFIALQPSQITAQDKSNTVLEDVIKAYVAGGIDGVRKFAQENKSRLTAEKIFVLAKSGEKLKNEIVIKIAITLAETLGDKKAIASSWYILGYVYCSSQKDSAAISAYSKALPLFIDIGDSEGQAAIYDDQGTIYFRAKKNNLALESYSKALLIYQKSENFSRLMSIYLSIGVIYSELGDDNSALKMYSEALAIAEKLKDTSAQANLLHVIGIAYTMTNDEEKAVESFSRAAQLFGELKDSASLANSYSELGKTFKYMNKYQNALEMFSKALPLYEQTKNNSGQGDIHYNLGKIYLDIGDTVKARNAFSKALPFYEKENKSLEIGLCHQSLGDVLNKSDDKKKAYTSYLKAAVYYKRALFRNGLSNLYLQLGGDFSFLGQYKLSLETYSQALPIFESSQDILGQAKVNLESGRVYFKMGENAKATEMFSKATPLIEKANATGMKADLLLAKANLFSKVNDRNKAFQQYDSAMTILEKIRTETGFAEMKMTYVEKIGQSIEDAVLFMINNNYLENAFKYLESIKARTLLDQLTEKNIGHVDKGLNPDLKKTRDKLMTKLSFTKSSLTRTMNEDEISKLQKEQNKLEEEWDKLSQQIRFQNPAYAAVMYPQTVSVKELQTKVLKPEEALLNYFVGANNIYVFVVTTDTFKIIKLPNNTAALELEVSNSLRNLRNNRQIYESGLYQMLIEPASELLRSKKTLLIAPDGFLTTIPFESIIVSFDESKNKYLIEDYTIKYIQSATMLSMLRTILKRTNAGNKFIGFGDPVYDYENFIAGKPEKGEREKLTANLKGNSYDRSGGLMIRLEGSGKEVKEIAKLFGANKSKIFTRADSKEENIKQPQLKEYGYIVLSCHGLASDEFQSLVLSQLPNSEEDGYLTIDEIMNLDWNARLVVLSACQTGKGKIRRGEGVIGLTRAVMHAGTDAAVVSLWNVSDEGTKELMIKLFKNILQKKLSKEEALRKAKLEMLNGKFSNPYFWSAFIMYGE